MRVLAETAPTLRVERPQMSGRRSAARADIGESGTG